jgi:hypothetical protein
MADATGAKYNTAIELQSKTLWLGVPNLNADQLKNFDPSYTGHVHIFVIKVPLILTSYDTKYGTKHGANFKAILERLSTSFTGIPELTLNSVEQTHGFADRKIPHPTFSEFNFDQATIRTLEFKGLPVFNAIRTWIELISDPVSKIQDYKGLAADMVGGFSIANHTCSFIVVNSDPTHTKIEGRAHYITAAFPVNQAMENFNWNAGEIGIVEGHDIALKGVLRYGPVIDDRAQELLDNRKTIINYYSGHGINNVNFFTAAGTLNGEAIVAQSVLKADI